jgi:hypothetical protein
MGLFNMDEVELMEICFYKYTKRASGMVSPGGEKRIATEARKHRKRTFKLYLNEYELTISIVYRLLLF